MSFTMWIYRLGSDTVKSEFFGSLFSFDDKLQRSYPHPSLALTSALSNVFLPFIQRYAPSSDFNHAPLMTVNGRLSLFYANLLFNYPDIISVLEDKDNSDRMSELMYFLFLQSTLAKDKLALPSSNSLWDDNSGVGELEFMKLPSICVNILERVFAFLIET